MGGTAAPAGCAINHNRGSKSKKMRGWIQVRESEMNFKFQTLKIDVHIHTKSEKYHLWFDKSNWIRSANRVGVGREGLHVEGNMSEMPLKAFGYFGPKIDYKNMIYDYV